MYTKSGINLVKYTKWKIMQSVWSCQQLCNTMDKLKRPNLENKIRRSNTAACSESGDRSGNYLYPTWTGSDRCITRTNSERPLLNRLSPPLLRNRPRSPTKNQHRRSLSELKSLSCIVKDSLYFAWPLASAAGDLSVLYRKQLIRQKVAFEEDLGWVSLHIFACNLTFNPLDSHKTFINGF